MPVVWNGQMYVWGGIRLDVPQEVSGKLWSSELVRALVDGNRCTDEQPTWKLQQLVDVRDMWVLDLRSRMWKKVRTATEGPLPAPRAMHTASVHEAAGKMYVFGGYNLVERSGAEASCAPYGDLWEYDFRSAAWTRLAVYDGRGGPMIRYGHASWLAGNKLYIYGGATTRKPQWNVAPAARTVLASNPLQDGKGVSVIGDVWSWDLDKMQWEECRRHYGNSPGRRMMMGCVQMPNPDLPRNADGSFKTQVIIAGGVTAAGGQVGCKRRVRYCDMTYLGDIFVMPDAESLNWYQVHPADEAQPWITPQIGCKLAVVPDANGRPTGKILILGGYFGPHDARPRALPCAIQLRLDSRQVAFGEPAMAPEDMLARADIAKLQTHVEEICGQVEMHNLGFSGAVADRIADLLKRHGHPWKFARMKELMSRDDWPDAQILTPNPFVLDGALPYKQRLYLTPFARSEEAAADLALCTTLPENLARFAVEVPHGVAAILLAPHDPAAELGCLGMGACRMYTGEAPPSSPSAAGTKKLLYFTEVVRVFSTARAANEYYEKTLRAHAKRPRGSAMKRWDGDDLAAMLPPNPRRRLAELLRGWRNASCWFGPLDPAQALPQELLLIFTHRRAWVKLLFGLLPGTSQVSKAGLEALTDMLPVVEEAVQLLKLMDNIKPCCAFCKRTAEQGTAASKLKFCRGCCLLRYCSEKCQADHWHSHQEVCRAQGVEAVMVPSKKGGKGRSKKPEESNVSHPMPEDRWASWAEYLQQQG